MKGSKSYSVAVPILNFNAQGTNEFKDVAANTVLNPANKPNLIVAITGIETYYSGLYSQDSSQRPIVSQADAAKLAITLRVGSDEPFYQVPYLSYCTILNYGKIKEIVPTPINLSKSIVIVQQALANNTFSAIFNFWYETFTQAEWQQVLKNIKENQIRNPRTSHV